MSSGTQIAVLGAPARAGRHSNESPASAGERPLLRLATFAAFGLYGVIRWGTMLSPAPGGRLLGLLALAILIAGAGGIVVKFSRAAAIVGAVLAFVAMLVISGVPFSLVWHLRVIVTAERIGNGLTALPNALVPYPGPSDWVRIVIVLGAGVLLLDAAFVLALAPRALGDLQRAGAALPLLALAVVPSTLLRPSLPYLQGLLLFALLAAFVWAERIRPGKALSAGAIVAAVGIAAAIIAPGLDRHKPWFDYEALAGTLSPTHVETFSWQQQYGPLRWPRTGHQVLEVKAARPEYWKAENLDVFDGYGFTQGLLPSGQSAAQPAIGAVARWTQTIQVTIKGMETTDVIASGTAQTPQHLSTQVLPAASPGTWVSTDPLGPGDSYTVSIYNPSPTSTQLGHAGSAYPAALSGYRSLSLASPQVARGAAPTVVFPPFHASTRAVAQASDAARIAQESPYARAYALAQTLARRARTPYAYVEAVLAYLRRGFVYDENPPPSRYPLENFLFVSKLGYCQQFSGAMTLLLRMGGIPARVAAGFTAGSYDSNTGRWDVSDIDAHDWVEAWFPSYGWVRFDPTPATAPARSSTAILPAVLAPDEQFAKPHAAVRKASSAPASTVPTVSGHRGSGPDLLLIVGVVVLVILLALVARAAMRVTEPSTEELILELERGLRRCGRPLSVGVTLAELEQRFHSTPEAADYIRALRLARFAGGSERPTIEQRRALRMQLASGLGLSGIARAFWALPPRVHLRQLRSRSSSKPRARRRSSGKG
ncbi:MAG: transglutaminase domain-containing protein [Solirubrobacterales bacterium]|nr:transglutaminase domain-containing protein [Solirubrobacterales bacterium]